jgi:hypothetical protein
VTFGRSNWVRTATLLLALTAVAGACQNKNTHSSSPSAELLRAQNAKSMTLQFADLPSGGEEGVVVEINPQNLDEQHAAGKVSDSVYRLLSESTFKAVATHSFTLRGNGSVFSLVAVFENSDVAIAFFKLQAPARAIDTAPALGDESFSERVAASSTIVGERVVTATATGSSETTTTGTASGDDSGREAVRTRVRINNVVIDVIEADDAAELSTSEALDLAKAATLRVTNKASK